MLHQLSYHPSVQHSSFDVHNRYHQGINKIALVCQTHWETCWGHAIITNFLAIFQLDTETFVLLRVIKTLHTTIGMSMVGRFQMDDLIPLSWIRVELVEYKPRDNK